MTVVSEAQKEPSAGNKIPEHMEKPKEERQAFRPKIEKKEEGKQEMKQEPWFKMPRGKMMARAAPKANPASSSSTDGLAPQQNGPFSGEMMEQFRMFMQFRAMTSGQQPQGPPESYNIAAGEGEEEDYDRMSDRDLLENGHGYGFEFENTEEGEYR